MPAAFFVYTALRYDSTEVTKMAKIHSFFLARYAPYGNHFLQTKNYNCNVSPIIFNRNEYSTIRKQNSI